mmetsp:Transcript_10992/g.15291  ORF Transcript_10992/g.15291 Transcript_10992/m.15291 type:complete len:125 (+) Transcript_10992:116-490(+)
MAERTRRPNGEVEIEVKIPSLLEPCKILSFFLIAAFVVLTYLLSDGVDHRGDRRLLQGLVPGFFHNGVYTVPDADKLKPNHTSNSIQKKVNQQYRLADAVVSSSSQRFQASGASPDASASLMPQ